MSSSNGIPDKLMGAGRFAVGVRNSRLVPAAHWTYFTVVSTDLRDPGALIVHSTHSLERPVSMHAVFIVTG